MHKPASGTVIGVDVGGTFTDLVHLDSDSGAVKLAKVPSTIDNQAVGVIAALEAARVDLATTGLIVHGTTTTTNAVLERKLARTGLITTRGFRDVLELGRRTRPAPYGMKGRFVPVIPRDLRLEVSERMDASGNVVTPLDEAELRTAARTLLDAGCVSVVVHFLHAYANPAHEQRAAEILRTLWPNDHITTGHQLLSESREFERGVTAAINAAVQPLLERYIARLNDELERGGYRNELLVMNGNGGMVSSRLVSREAAKTVMSGPASGVMAAAYTGRRAGFENLLTYDMGGTSTDVALIRDATPSVSNEIEIEYAMPVHVPMVDVRTVGAGGGSIARVTSAGLLEVGPESAGADPGPIFYGRGGEAPTISDANLLLGRLDPGRLNTGQDKVSLAQVEAIFEARLASPLGLSVREAAAAVIRMANTRMAGAIRMVSLSLGVDPRDFALFAFGGAGPLHAAEIARELGVPRVLVPSRPGMTNALGCVVADLRQDFVNTINRPLDTVGAAEIAEVLEAQRARGEAMLNAQGVGLSEIRHQHSADMQFVGQTHLLRVPLDDATPGIDAVQAAFEKAYEARFQLKLDRIRANLVNLNSSVIGLRPALDLSTLIDPAMRKASLEEARTGTREVHFDTRRLTTPIYRRELLPVDVTLPGPAIVEQMDTTLVIPPGDMATGDPDGNLVIHVGGAP